MKRKTYVASASRQVYPGGVQLRVGLSTESVQLPASATLSERSRVSQRSLARQTLLQLTTAGDHRSSRRCTPAARRGLSLFEVLIALAIFVCSMAAIGQLISSGVRAAVQARLQSQAVLRAESKMAEVVAGITSLHGASGTFSDDTNWSWAAASTQDQQPGLYLVEVTVSHAGMTTSAKQSFTLRRLVRDPQLALDEYAKEQEEAANAATTSSSGSSGSGSGSSGGSSTSGGSR